MSSPTAFSLWRTLCRRNPSSSSSSSSSLGTRAWTSTTPPPRCIHTPAAHRSKALAVATRAIAAPLLLRPGLAPSLVAAFSTCSPALLRFSRARLADEGQRNTPTTPPSPTPTPASPPSPSQSGHPPPPQPQPALSEDIATLPNLLTISRLLLTPYIGYLVCTSQFTPACLYLFLAGFSDLLDGWLARRTGRFTVFGSIADPAADKALMTTMVVSLTWCGSMPIWLAAIILGRDVALVASAFVIRWRTLQPPKTWRRYWDPRLPTATVTPTRLSKWNTFLQLLLVGLLTILPVLVPETHPSATASTTDETAAATGAATGEAETEQGWKNPINVGLQAFMLLVAFTTVWSGLGYVGGAGSAKVSLRERVRQRLPSSVTNSKKGRGGQ